MPFGGERGDILDLVRRLPGISLFEIMQKVPLGVGTVYLHVDRLQRAGYIRCHRSGRHIILTPAWATTHNDAAHSAMLAGTKDRHILQLVNEHPGIDPQQIATLLAIPGGQIHFHLARLARASLLTLDGEGVLPLHPSCENEVDLEEHAPQ